MNTGWLRVCAASSLFVTVYGLVDGNPWGWGRLRRCDDDYGINIDPNNPFSNETCGLCEGIGGIVWGDALEDFQATDCEIIATADEVRPVGVASWEGRFTAEVDEIFVNECTTEAACDFPGENSTLPHAYVRQHGHWHLDFFAEEEGGTDHQRTLFNYDWMNDVRGSVGPDFVLDTTIGKTDIYHYNGVGAVNGVHSTMIVYAFDGEATFNFGDICICLAQKQGQLHRTTCSLPHN